MHHAHAAQRLAAGERRVDAREMIFHITVLPIPWGLIIEGGRVIALSLPVHGHPGQVRDAHGHAQRGLPVAAELVAAEIKVPVGHAVELGEHAFAPELAGGGLRLLGGGKLTAVIEHVNARQLEAAVGAHGFPERPGLRKEGGLFHHVAGQHQAVVMAPCADLVGKGLGKTLRDMVVEMIAEGGRPVVGQIPEELGQPVEEIIPIGLLKGLRQVIGPGQGDIPGIGGVIQGLLSGKLRFIGKNGGDQAAKILPDMRRVGVMGDMEKLLHAARVKGVDIGLVVVPGIIPCDFPVNIQRKAFCMTVFFHAPIGFQRAVRIQGDIKGGEKRGVCSLLSCKHGIALTEGRILCDQSAGRAGGPAVLIIEPDQHVFLTRLFHTGLDQLKKLFAQVFRFQTGPHMDMDTAVAHLLELFHLPEQVFFIQLAVPGPERGAAVLTARIGEQAFRHGFMAFGIEHRFSSFVSGTLCDEERQMEAAGKEQKGRIRSAAYAAPGWYPLLSHQQVCLSVVTIIMIMEELASTNSHRKNHKNTGTGQAAGLRFLCLFFWPSLAVRGDCIPDGAEHGIRVGPGCFRVIDDVPFPCVFAQGCMDQGMKGLGEMQDRPLPAFLFGEHTALTQESQDPGQVQRQVHGVFGDFLIGMADILPYGIKIIRPGHLAEGLFDRKPEETLSAFPDDRKVGSQVRIGSLHLLNVVIRMFPVPGQVRFGKVQFKGCRVDKGTAEGGAHDAHFNAFGGGGSVQLHGHIHEGALDGVRERMPDEDDQINVTDCGMKASHDGRPVQVDAEKMVSQDVPGAGDKCPEERFYRAEITHPVFLRKCSVPEEKPKDLSLSSPVRLLRCVSGQSGRY